MSQAAVGMQSASNGGKIDGKTPSFRQHRKSHSDTHKRSVNGGGASSRSTSPTSHTVVPLQSKIRSGASSNGQSQKKSLKMVGSVENEEVSDMEKGEGRPPCSTVLLPRSNNKIKTNSSDNRDIRREI